MLLQNGAKAICYSELEKASSEIKEHGLVMAYWEGRNLPWVTWVARKEDSGEWSCYNGHYFRTAEEALRDFDERNGTNGH